MPLVRCTFQTTGDRLGFSSLQGVRDACSSRLHTQTHTTIQPNNHLGKLKQGGPWHAVCGWAPPAGMHTSETVRSKATTSLATQTTHWVQLQQHCRDLQAGEPAQTHQSTAPAGQACTPIYLDNQLDRSNPTCARSAHPPTPAAGSQEHTQRQTQQPLSTAPTNISQAFLGCTHHLCTQESVRTSLRPPATVLAMTPGTAVHPHADHSPHRLEQGAVCTDTRASV
jgi:hypothetical protein